MNFLALTPSSLDIILAFAPSGCLHITVYAYFLLTFCFSCFFLFCPALPLLSPLSLPLPLPLPLPLSLSEIVKK